MLSPMVFNDLSISMAARILNWYHILSLEIQESIKIKGLQIKMHESKILKLYFNDFLFKQI